MIGTIRKHSSWLWILIAGLTIISFVVFMGSGPSRNRGNGGGSSGNDFGSVYGHAITTQEYVQARNEFYLFYWFRNQAWPDKASGVSPAELDQQIYENLLLSRKAADLGIHLSDDELAAAAAQMLRAINHGQEVQMSEFYQKVLQPEGLSIDDFENFVRADVTVQQLIQTLGMSGMLVTPQEAASLYDRENQEFSVQAVFFSASNHLAQTSIAPAAVGQFFTNNMAYYREPDRVQVSYVAFNVTNFFAQSKAEWDKTNFEENVDAIYRQYGATQFADEKSPETAKAKIRDAMIRQRALGDASIQAKEFVTALFAMDPVKPENLDAVAKQKGLVVHTTTPFAETEGPVEIAASESFTKAAFQLNTDSPFAGPIVDSDAVYVIALVNQLPSSIPSFDLIQSRVTRDFQMQQAIAIAQQVGTNFYSMAVTQMAAGKTFAQAAIAAGQAPEALPAFSLSSAEVPGFDGRAEIGQLKRVAFNTPAGKMSSFTPTAEGGFILYVQSLLPVDEMKKQSDLPQYLAQLRRARENEAFGLWINGEINHQLSASPYFHQQLVAAEKQSR